MQFKKPFLANLKRRTSNFILYIQILALIGVFLIILLGQVNVSTISSRLTDWYMLIVKPLTIFDYTLINKSKKIKELFAENTILKKQLAELDFIKLENKKIKALSNYHVLHGFRYITTRAFLNVSNDLHELCFLDAGYVDGVQKYSAVINAEGLVGMVIEVGKHWSRMISVFDRLFKIPVICVQSNIEAIISGTSQKITFGILSEDKKLLPNDKVITSGRCGHFPPGILVGTISDNKLEASVNFKTVDYVLIITKVIDNKNNTPLHSGLDSNNIASNANAPRITEIAVNTSVKNKPAAQKADVPKAIEKPSKPKETGEIIKDNTSTSMQDSNASKMPQASSKTGEILNVSKVEVAATDTSHTS